ncbi:MAG: PEP-CTERM sorting domain-containing protein [Verrucomicrobiaceae bacterium]|nr:PEP-CTERM sorting domain-containing protein [Verrucomicrobiaceae bacterium]
MESNSVLKDGAISAGFYKDTKYVQGEFLKQFDIAENTDKNYIKEVMDYVIDNNGAFTLGIVNPDLEIGHALTLWGYEIVDDEIIGLYISDSDDDCETNFFLGIEWDNEFDGGSWFLQSDYENYYIDSIMGLITVPEPSTYAVIFGAIALGFVASRRRK